MSNQKPVPERNTLTTINELEIGDRFYLKSDKQRLTWSKVNGNPRVTEYQTYSNWGMKDGNNKPMVMKNNTQVVFLRRPSPINPKESLLSQK